MFCVETESAQAERGEEGWGATDGLTNAETETAGVAVTLAL